MSSPIPIVLIQHTKRSQQGNNSAPTGKHEAEKKDEDDGYLNDEESLSGQNWKRFESSSNKCNINIQVSPCSWYQHMPFYSGQFMLILQSVRFFKCVFMVRKERN